MAELDHEAVYRHVFDVIHALEPTWTMIPAGDDGQAFEPGSRPSLPFLTIKVVAVDMLGHTWPDAYEAGQLSYRRKVSPSISVQWFGAGGVSALSSILRRLETPDHTDLEVILEHEFEFVRALRRPQNQTLGLEGVFEPRAGMDFSIAIWETWQRAAERVEQVEITYDFDDFSGSFVGG
jgi:hypothetical protein